METSLAGMNCRNKDSCINSDEIRVSVIQCQTKIGSRRRESETRILFETAITQFGCNFMEVSRQTFCILAKTEQS